MAGEFGGEAPLPRQGGDRHRNRSSLEQLLTSFDQQLDAHVRQQHGDGNTWTIRKEKALVAVIEHFNEVRMRLSQDPA